MRDVHFATRPGCGMCEDILQHVVLPLAERHPDHVKVHYGWDADMDAMARG